MPFQKLHTLRTDSSLTIKKKKKTSQKVDEGHYADILWHLQNHAFIDSADHLLTLNFHTQHTIV